MPTAQQTLPTAEISVEIVSSEADFLALEPEWDQLLKQTPADSFFLSWSYVSSWWSIYRDRCELRVLTARNGAGELVGVAPLVIGRGEGVRRHLRLLSFLGALGDSLSEYLDFIVRPEAARTVIPEFWRIMTAAIDGWDLLRLPLVPASSDTRALLGERSPSGVGHLRETNRQPSPFIRLEGDWEAYLSSRSKNFRKAFKTAWNRAHKRHDARVLHGGVDISVDEAMNRLITLNRERWGAAGLAFHTDEFCAFHRLLAPKLAQRGELSLMILQLDGEDAAIRYDFVYAERLWVFQGGWSPELSKLAPGRILTAYSVKWCFENGLSEYDFLAGDAAYKQAWATDTRDLIDLELGHPHSLRARAYRALRATRRYLKR